MKIDKLTIETILCPDGRLVFACPEMGICELPLPDEQEESLSGRVESLMSHCEELLVVLWDAKEIEETPAIAQLLQGIDLDQVRHQIKCRREEWAVLRNYPSLEGHWNVRIAIPFPDWDMPEEEWYDSKEEFQKAFAEWEWMEKAEEEAWEALIRNGRDDPKWIAWIQWITKMKLPAFAEQCQKETWERWKETGLPVLSFKETVGK